MTIEKTSQEKKKKEILEKSKIPVVVLVGGILLDKAVQNSVHILPTCTVFYRMPDFLFPCRDFCPSLPVHFLYMVATSIHCMLCTFPTLHYEVFAA